MPKATDLSQPKPVDTIADSIKVQRKAQRDPRLYDPDREARRARRANGMRPPDLNRCEIWVAWGFQGEPAKEPPSHVGGCVG